jgi:hypothetical protein
MAQRPVLTTIETRTQLSDILRRFRAEGEQAEPLLGDHRTTEAVLIPCALWQRLEAAADDPELLADLYTEHGEPLPGTEEDELPARRSR